MPVICTIISDKSHSLFVTIVKKISESIVISYEQNKKQTKKRMINYSIDLI